MAWDDQTVKLEYSDAFRRCLIELDVDGIMELWAHVAPHLAAQSRQEALITLHLARTEAQSVPIRLRRYSDKWLRERGLGSCLDRMQREKTGRMI